ncbi:acyl-[acyl-carrier-protein] thioesterase [Sphaerochaeta sp. PS]|uniref:acyl-[acyl-carrier-protein] thioesterase n=1 Tax=Sphaerochaeta sp. PS TaxID=3076336 RepID=UPI0028A3FA92|nr:acyl-ACP thioesterase domain-containing protein [Sphaerochaeta sp. PS]MDT4762629.1 thioesterase [Sphaerochaeta sp. PS]
MKHKTMTIDENNIAHSQFTTYSYETDCFFEARLAFYFQIVQEAAGNHAAERGCSIPALHREGNTWVITRTKMQIHRYTQWPEQVVVETWAQKPIRLHLPRVVRSFDEERNPIFTAQTYWALIDLEKGRPCRPTTMSERIGLPPEEMQLDLSLTHRLGYEESGCTTLVSYRPRIQYLDTDSNLHVNNISYLNWALDSLPAEFRNRSKIAEADVSWVRQTFSGDEIKVYTGSCDEKALFGDEALLYHKIIRTEKDGSLTTVWEGTTRWEGRSSFRGTPS